MAASSGYSRLHPASPTPPAEQAAPRPVGPIGQDSAQRIERLGEFKARLSAYPALNDWIMVDGEQAVGVLEHGRFESRYLPVLRLATRSAAALPFTPDAFSSGDAIGWRGTLLAYDRTAVLVSSAAMFASISRSSLLISLDRMTRALHVINYFSSDASGLLFLPVHERLLSNVRHEHGKYFARVLGALGVDPTRVVIELPAVCATQNAFLEALLSSYHRHGFQVAVAVPETNDMASLALTRWPEFLMLDRDVDDDLGGTVDHERAVALSRLAGDHGTQLTVRAAHGARWEIL